MMLNLIVNVGLLCCLAFSYPTTVPSQSWRKFSPPDKSLVVELPALPKLVTNKEDSPDILFENVKSSYSYTVDLGSTLNSDSGIVFGALRISKAMSNRSFDKTVNLNMLVVGGDDKTFSKQSDITVNGIHGREFVYDKAGNAGRAVWLNGRTRIYFLISTTDSNNKTSPDMVSRVFNTFRPLR